MRIPLICCLALGVAVTPVMASAQEMSPPPYMPATPPVLDNTPDDTLTCQDLTIPITNVPDDTPVVFTIPLDDMKNRCASSSGSTVTLVLPTSPISVSITPNSSQSFTFSAKDDAGSTASGTVTVTRN